MIIDIIKTWMLSITIKLLPNPTAKLSKDKAIDKYRASLYDRTLDLSKSALISSA